MTLPPARAAGSRAIRRRCCPGSTSPRARSGQGLPIGVGHGAGRQAARPAALPQSGCSAATARWPRARCGRRFEHAALRELDNLTAIVDVNRLGQRGETMHGWDLDIYADRARAFGWHAIEIDGHDVEAIDRAYAEAERDDGPADRDRRPDDEGQGRRRRSRTRAAGTARRLDDAEAAIEELGGVRNDRRRRGRSPSRRPPHGFDDRRARAARATSSARRWRRARPTATRWPRSAARAATWSRSTARSRTRPTPRSSQGRSRSATSRCTSPSSRWSRRPSGCRCAAGSRSPRPSPRSSRAPTTSSAWRRSPRRHRALRLARRRLDRRGRARRRWRSRTWPCSARSTARRCSTRATRTRRRSWSHAMADLDGISSCARRGPRRRWSTAPDEEFPVGGRACVRESGDDDVAIVGGRDHAARGAEGRGRRWPRRASRPA